MSIYFHKEDREIPNINQKGIVSVIDVFCSRLGKTPGDVNFIYCSDEYLLDMNKKYLDHDYFTDVITFNYCEGEIVSGDIFMSRDRMEDNARKLEMEMESEFVRVCGHGFFHLLGFDDSSDSDKIIMSKNEDEFIELLKDF
jgi:probable rRNA maturation factor